MNNQEQKNQTGVGQPNPYLMPIAILVAGILIAGTIFLTGGGSLDSNTPRSGTPNDSEVAEESDFEAVINIEGWSFLGDEDAPVVMVEYSDFACSFCARFWGDTLPLIKERYVDTGQVKFVYKDFPVVGGAMAAEAAHCASEQDAYWEYHDLLFSRVNQDRQTWNDVEVHRDYANRLNLDATALVECFKSRRYQEKISESAREAQALGGSGTPFFVVNGTPISGAQPFCVFQQAIEQALID